MGGTSPPAELGRAGPWHTTHIWEPSVRLPMGGDASESTDRAELSIPHAEWFVGGKLNVAVNCVDRHVEAGNGDRVAIHFEIESALVSHPEVGEAAVVGVSDPVTGEAIAAFIAPSRALTDEQRADPQTWLRLTEELSATLRAHVAHEIGPIAKPRDVLIVPDVPRLARAKSCGACWSTYQKAAPSVTRHLCKTRPCRHASPRF